MYINHSSMYVVLLRRAGSNHLVHRSWKKSRCPNISPVRLEKIMMLIITHTEDSVETLLKAI